MSFDCNCYAPNCCVSYPPNWMEKSFSPAWPPRVDDWRWKSMIEICQREARGAIKLPQYCENSMIDELSRVSGCSRNSLMKYLLPEDICNCKKEPTIPFTDMSKICYCFNTPIYFPLEKQKKKNKRKSCEEIAPGKQETVEKVCCPCTCPCMPPLLVKKRLGHAVYYVEVKPPQFPINLHKQLIGDCDPNRCEFNIEKECCC